MNWTKRIRADEVARRAGARRAHNAKLILERTVRQEQAVKLLVSGMDAAAVAEQLGMKPSTIGRYRRNYVKQSRLASLTTCAQ